MKVSDNVFPKLRLTEGEAPATPPEGQVALFAKPGGGVFVKRADGSEELLASTGASLQSIIVACSDEATPLTVGAGKVTFRMPYAFALAGVRASLTVAQTAGATLTVDVNGGGVSILSTKLTIDNGERTSATAAVSAVLETAMLADDAEVTIDLDQVGDGTARGLKVALIGIPV